MGFKYRMCLRMQVQDLFLYAFIFFIIRNKFITLICSILSLYVMLPCRLPGRFTDMEAQILQLISLLGSSIGLPLISFIVFIWATNSVRFRKQYLIFSFVSISAFFTLWTLIVSAASQSVNLFCNDNATQIDENDGLTVCVVQGVITMYCGIAISYCWCVQSVELFLKVVMKQKGQNNISVQLFFIFICPIGSVVYTSFYSNFGYGRILPYCFISYESSLIPLAQSAYFYSFYIPVYLSTLIGSVCITGAILKIVTTSLVDVHHINPRVQPDTHGERESEKK